MYTIGIRIQSHVRRLTLNSLTIHYRFPLLFKRDSAGVRAFCFEGQTVQVGSNLENAHDGVIRDLYKHAVAAERAGDLGWNAGSLACLVCHRVSHHIYYSFVGMPQGLY